MSRIPWSFTDSEMATPDVYYFDVNPKADNGSFAVQKGISYSVVAGQNDGSAVIHETVDDIMKVSYSGIMLSMGQYFQFLTWVSKDRPVTLTDDLGQQSLIYIESLGISRAPKRHYGSRQEYTLTAFVLEIL